MTRIMGWSSFLSIANSPCQIGSLGDVLDFQALCPGGQGHVRPHHHNPGLDQIAGQPKADRYRLLRLCCKLDTVATKNSLADLRGGCYRLALRVSLARSLSKASK